ncbi:hypothetical protein ACFY84_07365 [Streptomyces sp. NPDC012438]|uniref:hypothetical protein n=1 Tax=Streptomyces sp. NPDC012438 TaxID=3364833 RepID=UPI0036EC51DF
MPERIEAVDWGAVPGPPGWYEPERVGRGLRVLSGASSLVRAAEAGSLLGCGGIVHDHGGSVFPAAAIAAPLLLDIARRGHPAARDTALVLLDEALSFHPHPGYERVAEPDGTEVPLCCALAHHLRAHADLLTGLGGAGRTLLADAAAHWRFEIRECVADGGGTAAFGLLTGRFPDGVHAARMHLGGTVIPLNGLTLDHPPEGDSPEAFLRLLAHPPAALPPGTLLLPAECGYRVH